MVLNFREMVVIGWIQLAHADAHALTTTVLEFERQPREHYEKRI